MLRNLRSIAIGNLLGISFFAYFAVLLPAIDPRMNDQTLDWSEMYFFEYPIAIIGLFSIFALIFSSFRSAWKKGHRVLSILMLFLWPLSFVYSWYIAYGYLHSDHAS